MKHRWLAMVALLACAGSACAARSREANTPVAKIESIRWKRVDQNNDGKSEFLQAAIVLRLPPRASVANFRSQLFENDHHGVERRLATAADPRLIRADYMRNSVMLAEALADSVGRCTLLLAFDGDSLRLAQSDGKWTAHFWLVWELGPRSTVGGELTRSVQTPPQRATLFGREWTHLSR